MKFPVIFLWASLASCSSQAQEWSDSSRWLFETLNARFADQAGDYQGASQKVNRIASESKQYDVYSYAFELSMNNSNFAEAESIASQWLEHFPNDDDAELALLRVLFQLHKSKEIATHAEALLRRSPEPQIIAQISRMAGDYPERIELFQDLAKRFPKNPYLFYYLGLIAKEQGQVTVALDAFDRALALDGNWRKLELMRVEVLSEIGELKKALAIIDRLRQRAPNDPELLSLNIDILADHYQWEKALPLAEKWLQLQPKEPRIMQLLAWLYSQSGQSDKARHYYDQLLQNQQIEEESYNFHMAQLLERDGKEEEAKRFLEKINPKSQLLMLGQQESALQALRRGQLQQGREKFARLREQFPDYALEFYLLEIQQLLQQEQDVDELVAEAEKRFPRQSSLQLLLAENAARQKDFAKAEALYLQILEQDANNIDALNGYGYLLLRQKERQQDGAELIRAAIDAYPSAPAIQDSYAQLLAQEGKLKEALQWQRRAYAGFRDGEIVAHYIDLLMRNQQSDLAREIYSYEIKGQPKHHDLLQMGEKYKLTP